jgi:hypothetical protein
MKVIIACCLCELLETFGNEKWRDVMENAGLESKYALLAKEEVPDEDVYKLIEATCTVLGISMEQAAEAFGGYWMTVFAPKVYPSYLNRANSAKDFVVMLPGLHKYATENIPNAHPPRLELDWLDDDTLILTYNSHRPLIDLAIGLLKGVGAYYGDSLDVKGLEDNRIMIRFQG